MQRMTSQAGTSEYKVDENNISHNEDGYFGEAIEKLAIFENIYDDLLKSQIETSKELEKLRNDGKKNSVKFKELMVKKLTNSNMISVFKAYGI